MDGTAVQEVERLTLKGAAPQTINGLTFSAVPLTQVRRSRDPEPKRLEVHTLTGLADYVRENKDGLHLPALMLVVDDVDAVRLVGPVQGEHQQRFEHAAALGFKRSTFQYGHWYGVEDFIIGLLSQFDGGWDRENVMKIVGNVEDSTVQKQRDNGFGQDVSVKSSIGLETVPVPNPVTLAPFRTFPDVAQPESPFVLRVRKSPQGIQAALFEGDGGAWRVEAVKRIKRWLQGELPDVAVIA